MTDRLIYRGQLCEVIKPLADGGVRIEPLEFNPEWTFDLDAESYSALKATEGNPLSFTPTPAVEPEDDSAESRYEAYVQTVTAAMLRHWRAGLRDMSFHSAVRAEFPDLSLAEYNGCADAAWIILADERGA